VAAPAHTCYALTDIDLLKLVAGDIYNTHTQARVCACVCRGVRDAERMATGDDQLKRKRRLFLPAEIAAKFPELQK